MNAKARTGTSETRDRISQLLRITVQTGFLTSVMAVPAAPLFVFSNDTEYYSLTYANNFSYLVARSLRYLDAYRWYALGKLCVLTPISNPVEITSVISSYVISLLANLNARTYRPSASPQVVRGNDSAANIGLPIPSDPTHSSSNGVLSYIRSAVLTIHRHLTSLPNDLDLRVDHEAQLTFKEGGPLEAAHPPNDGSEEVSWFSEYSIPRY